jgi:hypothetical protein
MEFHRAAIVKVHGTNKIGLLGVTSAVAVLIA